MKCIVAVDKNWAIGKDNGLLVHLPGDLKFFKENTMGKVVIMGRKTLESLPGGKPLPSRTTIVITKDENYMSDFTGTDTTKLLVATNFDELMSHILTMEFMYGIDIAEDIFVAGGESIYKMLFPYCQEFIVTKIQEAFPADKHFPNLDKLLEDGSLKVKWQSDVHEENGIKYSFNIYTR